MTSLTRFVEKSSITREVNKRYVDDQVGLYCALGPGAKWCSESMDVVFGSEEEKLQDQRLPDQRTMDVIKDAANSISSHIQMTSDCPSANPGGMMPVLDLQCWVEKGEILYQHYRKPMCSDITILSSSALPARTKRNTHSQEVVRTLRNCHRGLEWERVADILTGFMRRLKTSGYGARYCAKILKAGLRGFRKMVEVETAGGRRVNRHDSTDQKLRKVRKLREEKTWYKRGGHDTVLFVPATPNGELAKIMRSKEQQNSQGRTWKVKVVENAGRMIKSALQKADPTPKTPCGNPECMGCPNGCLGQCSKEGAVYRVHCTHPTCGKEGVRYWGESSRTLSLRQEEHQRGLTKEKKESPFWQTLPARSWWRNPEFCNGHSKQTQRSTH